MATEWQTARVFISSTFRDMHAERDHLVKVVFPALRERLEPHRIHLVDIDLRWGITKEQSENDQVLDLCLNQIDDCRPFFVGLLGQRYGWVPDSLSDGKSKHGWTQHHTGKSVTELEIRWGVLLKEEMRDHGLFFFADQQALQTVAEDGLVDNDEYAELDERLREIVHGYAVVYLKGLEKFGQQVLDQLWEAIGKEFRLDETPEDAVESDPLAVELSYHERFMQLRLRVYVGRTSLQQTLTAFAEGSAEQPLLVTGPSGSGKSAALAKFADGFQKEYSQTVIIPHFVGASPGSTGLRRTLQRFCDELKRAFGFAEEVPPDTNSLITTFRQFITQIPGDRRVLLVIDALNQMDESKERQES